MKAKTIKALDAVIASLEQLKEALESEATKSGGGSDDEDTGKVSRTGKSAKAAGVPAKGKKPAAEPEDSDDDDLDDGGDDDDDDDGDELPLPKGGKVAAKTASAKKAASAKDKAKKGDDEKVTLDTVKAKLTEVMNTASLGKGKVVAILKKYGATKSSELDESEYAAVVKACDTALALAGDDEGDDDDDV